jgi:hypothetical protein
MPKKESSNAGDRFEGGEAAAAPVRIRQDAPAFSHVSHAGSIVNYGW